MPSCCCISLSILAASLLTWPLPVSAYEVLRSRNSLRLSPKSDQPQSGHDSDLRASIVAIYMNMPDRPERRAFAEDQFRTLGLQAIRVEGTALPNKKVGPSRTWLRALDVCAEQTKPLCLLSEDDAVFRPVDRVEGSSDESLDDPPWLADDRDEADNDQPAEANVAADAEHFFTELNTTLASLPGGADGSWHGLHLCAVGELEALDYLEGRRFEGGPWPNEKFTSHLLYAGAPGVLLLRRSESKVYRSKLQALMATEEAKHLQHPMDVLQPMLYSAEDMASEHAPPSDEHLKVFMAARPQLCQHLASLTSDPKYASSRPEFESR